MAARSFRKYLLLFSFDLFGTYCSLFFVLASGGNKWYGGGGGGNRSWGGGRPAHRKF